MNRWVLQPRTGARTVCERSARTSIWLWMWRRGVVDAGLRTTKGVVHGAVLPQHVMLQTGSAGLCWWIGAMLRQKRGKGFHQPLKAVVGRQRAWCPKYVFDKQPAMPALDIYRCANDGLYSRWQPGNG